MCTCASHFTLENVTSCGKVDVRGAVVAVKKYFVACRLGRMKKGSTRFPFCLVIIDTSEKSGLAWVDVSVLYY